MGKVCITTLSFLLEGGKKKRRLYVDEFVWSRSGKTSAPTYFSCFLFSLFYSIFKLTLTESWSHQTRCVFLLSPSFPSNTSFSPFSLLSSLFLPFLSRLALSSALRPRHVVRFPRQACNTCVVDKEERESLHREKLCVGDPLEK